MSLSRRRFIQQASVVSFSSLVFPGQALPSKDPLASARPLRFGVIADVHKDIMHDADERLSAFIDAATRELVDFIIQLGDFCVPKDANRGFLDIWKRWQGPAYHVLGNHDTDGGYTREQAALYLGMPSTYYSFDQGDFHIVVLDGNDRPADHVSGYPRYIDTEQQAWLREDLASTTHPTLVMVHQSLERADDGGVQNGAIIRSILEEANLAAGYQKVLACFSGHHHRDYLRQIQGIAYPQINSASYFWVGGDHQHVRYGQEVDNKYPWIKYTVPYKEALYAMVQVDPVRRTLTIEGRESEMVGPAPWDLGKTPEAWDAATLRASISDQHVSLPSEPVD